MWSKSVWILDSLLSYAVERRISSSWAPVRGLGVRPFIHHLADWERHYHPLCLCLFLPKSPLHSLVILPLLLPFSPSTPLSPSLSHDPFIRGPVCEAPTLPGPGARQTHRHFFARVLNRLHWLQRGLHGQCGECSVWSRGAPKALTGPTYPPRHGHVWKGILLRRGSRIRHAGASERWPSPQPVQLGVADQPHPRLPAAAHHRLGQRLLPLVVGPAEALHPDPGHPHAAGNHLVPERRCCHLRWGTGGRIWEQEEMKDRLEGTRQLYF